jgi:hypothetical protein
MEPDEPMYLSDEENVKIVLEVTGLAVDELESIVGRFQANSQWAGQLRGCAVVRPCGEVQLRHHFTKELLWES